MAGAPQQLSWLSAKPSPRLRSLCEVAKNSQCLADLEKSFDQHYVEAILTSHPNQSLYELIEILRTSIKSHAALGDLERTMDATNFLMRVTANLWTITKRDSDGSLVLWVRAGLIATLFGSASKLARGSAGWDAAIRAEVYMFETYYSRVLAKETYSGAAIVLDYRGQGWFDTNIALQRQIIGVLGRLFPGSGERVHLFGLSRAAAALVQVAKKVWTESMEGWSLHMDLKDVWDIVQDAEDIPRWFWEYDGKPEPCVDGKEIGDYRVCVGEGKGNKRSHASIFNPRAVESPCEPYEE